MLFGALNDSHIANVCIIMWCSNIASKGLPPTSYIYKMVHSPRGGTTGAVNTNYSPTPCVIAEFRLIAWAALRLSYTSSDTVQYICKQGTLPVLFTHLESLAQKKSYIIASPFIISVSTLIVWKHTFIRSVMITLTGRKYTLIRIASTLTGRKYTLIRIASTLTDRKYTLIILASTLNGKKDTLESTLNV